MTPAGRSAKVLGEWPLLTREREVRHRVLDNFIPDQEVTLWIVILATVCLICGILLRVMRAELKREEKEREGS